MDWLSDLLSGLAFVAVVAIGWLTIRLAREANRLSTEAVALAQRSTGASERSAEASADAARATEVSTAATLQAAEATERSVAASELAARLAAQDARVRRIEALLDVLLEMRATFNDQVIGQHGDEPRVRGYRTPEALERLALCRKLEVRLVPFEQEFAGTGLPTLTTTYNWMSGGLEDAISQVKDLLKQSLTDQERAAPRTDGG